MTKKDLFEKVSNAINNANDSDLFEVQNTYFDVNNDPDSRVYSMDEFDDMHSCMSPSDICLLAHNGDFNPNHEWFWYNGYGNLESSNYIDDAICKDELIEHICDNLDEYRDTDLFSDIEE